MSLAEGEAALAAGDWAAARTAFEAAEPSAEALAGLGTALMWLGETDAAVRAREQAYAAFCRRSDGMQAAVTALSLYFLFRSSLGNVAASRGWLARAARLVDDLQLPPLTAWVVLARAHDSDDPAAAERFAREACEAARSLGDSDLELCALSQLGIALVDLGRVEEGAAMLDEAMAASLAGEGEQIQTVVHTGCNMIMACSRAAQFDRATQWIRAAGPFTQRYGSPHLFALCRLHHGKVLLSTGDWAAAEAELEEALGGSNATEPSLTAETLAALAELRLAQNRVEEAAGLVAGVADHPAATLMVAALHLARDEQAAAAAFLRSLGLRAARGGPRGGDGTLTRREREVLALLGEGLSNRAIADRLFVSLKTAQHHVASVLFKLDLSNRAQAAAYAVRQLHEREHA